MPDERPDLRKYDEAMERKIVHLPPQLVSIAQELGDGVMAEGVRRALEQARDSQDTDSQ